MFLTTAKWEIVHEIQLYATSWLRLFSDAACCIQIENQKAAEPVKFALDRDPDSINDFIELVEALNNQGEATGAKRLTAFVCNNLSQHKFCSQAQR